MYQRQHQHQQKLWSHQQNAHTDVAHVLSGTPLIASLHTAGSDSVRVFSPSGGSRKLAVGDTELTTGNDSDADHSARLVGDALITPAVTAAGTEVDAFHTTTGARLWSYPTIAMATAASDDDPVYVLAGAPTAPQLVRLDPRTGRAIAVAALPPVDGHQPFTAGTVYARPTAACWSWTHRAPAATPATPASAVTVEVRREARGVRATGRRPAWLPVPRMAAARTPGSESVVSHHMCA